MNKKLNKFCGEDFALPIEKGFTFYNEKTSKYDKHFIVKSGSGILDSILINKTSNGVIEIYDGTEIKKVNLFRRIYLKNFKADTRIWMFSNPFEVWHFRNGLTFKIPKNTDLTFLDR